MIIIGLVLVGLGVLILLVLFCCIWVDGVVYCILSDFEVMIVVWLVCWQNEGLLLVLFFIDLVICEVVSLCWC